MVKEAESHAEEDKKRRELVEVRNQAEALIHSTERMLADLGDKVSAEDKTAVESAAADLKTAAEGEDVEAIKQKIDALGQASMKLGEAMYQQTQGAPGEDSGASAEAGGDAGSDEKVVDVDFEEVKDDDSKKSA
jgi:molecular chaperone DnaK